MLYANIDFKITRRATSVNWVSCGTCYTKTEGTELGGIELQRSSIFFFVGGDVAHLCGHPDVMQAMALWLTRSHVKLFCYVVSRFKVFYFLKLW